MSDSPIRPGTVFREIDQKASRENGTTEVTFVLPAEVEGEVVYVVGDFNNWQKTHPMTRQEDGLWKLAVEMEPDCDCQFRYLVDDQQWLNDPEADDYVPNPYGDHNCVVKT